MLLDRCGDPGRAGIAPSHELGKTGRHPPPPRTHTHTHTHMHTQHQHENQPILHPEHKARGECSPSEFQSASITPETHSKNIWQIGRAHV